MPLRKAVALNLRLILAGVLLYTIAPRTATPQEQTPPRTFTNSIGMKFVWIDPGSLRMGWQLEEPVHEVTLSKGFYLQTTEVTQRQWEAVMGTNPSYFKGPDRPVENVSWGDIQGFLRKLNAREKGSRYRLPTEAEWEYACRAGQKPEEAGNSGDVGWSSEDSEGVTHPVGQKKPNAWGLYDMRGNVWEWVQDWYGPYSAERQVDPQGPQSGVFRVLRGGSWNDHSVFTVDFRCALRGDPVSPEFRYISFGFRCARTF
jgi:formylglycine-generating enzyme required for sulfatase activity